MVDAALKGSRRLRLEKLLYPPMCLLRKRAFPIGVRDNWPLDQPRLRPESQTMQLKWEIA